MTLKEKNDLPVIAICYDFDKTLSPDDMQAQGYIQSIGFDVNEFWTKSNGRATENDMDQNLAYMLTMKEEAEGKVLFTKHELANHGSKVKLFPGVEEWFGRINAYGLQKGVKIEHYIISSGLKEMIEGTSIAGEFEKIYATSFYCNDKGVAVWPAQVVNYTNKTQFLFRISKGVLNVNDQAVNDYFAPENIRVPFRNMVYIGDSDTDIPCMKLVNSKDGYSIGVYNPDKKDKTKVYKMMRDNRISYYASADYSVGSELDKLVKLIIDKTVYNEQLQRIHYGLESEMKSQVDGNIKEDYSLEKKELISELDDSTNFLQTHGIIKRLSKFDNWSDDEVETLLKIAIDNGQVGRILGDPDLTDFYTKILNDYDLDNPNAKKVREKIE
ncbi:HAD family hydrolase [Streptococcus sp. H31]|uniref:HAD family hydrolase n=1 Tax=Streptococcus huangxiaojuni TaxID=3237239 RepID=UPI0034A444C2